MKNRSDEKELLDEDHIQQELLFKNLWELDVLNRISGGHAITIEGVKRLVTDRSKTYQIVDLGCGSGDTLKAIARWARRKGFKLRLTGVDKNADVMAYFEKHCSGYDEIVGFHGDYQEYLDTNIPIDVVVCSLFCHHLKDSELIQLFSSFSEKATTGFVINDLQRNWLAYYSAWLFTRVFNATRLAKNDGPVSVLRAFKKAELAQLLQAGKIAHFNIQKKRFFRFLVVANTAAHATR